MFKETSTWLIIILALATLGFGYLYKTSIEDLALANQAKDSLQAEIEKANIRLEIQTKQLASLEQEKQASQKDFRQTKSKLDELKGRQSTIKAKPGLVEIKIQKSFDLFMKDIQCVSGATEQC